MTNPLYLTTVFLIILEVCSQCLSEPEKSKLDLIAPDQSPTLDLIKKPICRFFSKVDKFFSDFIENKLPYFEEQPRFSLDNSLSKFVRSNELNGKSPGEMYDKLDNTLSHVENGKGLELAKTWKPLGATIGVQHTKRSDVSEYIFGPLEALRFSDAKTRRRRLVGKEPANKEYYSSVVRIYRNGTHLMTGVIIAKDLVATSASRLFDKMGSLVEPKDLIVKSLPEHDAEKVNDDFKMQEYQVIDIYLMPQYQIPHHVNYSTHDIALLRTESFIKLTSYPHIEPKPLAAPSDPPIPVKCSVVTWMKTPQDSNSSEDRYELKRIFVNLSDESRCKKEIDHFDEGTEYCALGLRSGADAGSPLFCSEKLTGLVSFSSGKDLMTFDVYTKIYAFNDFIEKAKMKSLLPANQHDLAKEAERSKVSKLDIPNSLILMCSFLSIALHFLINYY